MELLNSNLLLDALHHYSIKHQMESMYHEPSSPTANLYLLISSNQARLPAHSFLAILIYTIIRKSSEEKVAAAQFMRQGVIPLGGKSGI